jgi:hypothetical protein
MLVLQIISALLLLLNKFYVFKKKTIGWTFGIWGTVAIIIYFYLQMVLQNKGNLWIMVVYDCALLLLMVYGYLLSSGTNNFGLRKILSRWDLPFKFGIVTITTVVCIFLLSQALTANLIVLQFLCAAGGLIGTLLLAFNTKGTNTVGWIFYTVTHCLVTYLMWETGSPFIAICQIFSAVVAILGLRNELRKT